MATVGMTLPKVVAHGLVSTVVTAAGSDSQHQQIDVKVVRDLDKVFPIDLCFRHCDGPPSNCLLQVAKTDCRLRSNGFDMRGVLKEPIGKTHIFAHSMLALNNNNNGYAVRR